MIRDKRGIRRRNETSNLIKDFLMGLNIEFFAIYNFTAVSVRHVSWGKNPKQS